MKKKRILVTGAGSGVGQGVMKALRMSSLPIEIIAADIHYLNAGLYRADEAILIPKVEAPGSLEKITQILKEQSIDMVLIGSEFDLEFFSANQHEIEKKSGARVLASPLETVEIANDKFKTAHFLKQNNLPYAESFASKNLNEAVECGQRWGYPFLIKPRRGTSSRHVHVLNSESDLKKMYESVPEPMLQKLIDKPSSVLKNEYTCSIFKCRDGKLLGPFTARRTLRSGHSWVVEVKTFEEMRPLLKAIGEKLAITGPLNIQLILTEKGPVPFEFNARFSGTTAVRAHYGFNEPEMAVRHYLFGENNISYQIRNGLAFRYSEEVFVDGVDAEALKTPLPKGFVRPWF